MNNSEVIFSIKREDLAFDFAQNLEDIFLFSPFNSDKVSSADGIRQNESLGFDFKNEYSPKIEIIPLADSISKSLGIDKDDFVYHIAIEDIALNIRKILYSIPAKELKQKVTRSIDLPEHEDMSFYRGFEVRCFITRKNNIAMSDNIIWHKSQIIHQKVFVVKASFDEALFDITWIDFADENERKNVLYYIDWKSVDVSGSVDKDCFQVVANNSLKDQVKRLENNKNFGLYCIRMIAEQIVKELLIKTLRLASINEDEEPQLDSLHDKFEQLLKSLGKDFYELARKAQSTNETEQLECETEVGKLVQVYYSLGSNLELVKFGGSR